MSKVHNLTGQKFGRLTALRPTGERRRGQIVWACQCDCGKFPHIPSYHLHSGVTTSCGCYGQSILGDATRTHAMSNKPIYNTWSRMHARCYNPRIERYRYYGGRGIKVCRRWHKFENFYADMGNCPTSGHSLGRIDNDANYSPKNCRWETRDQQANNKSNCVFITANGITQTMAQWARCAGISESTIRRRMNRGLSDERAVA